MSIPESELLELPIKHVVDGWDIKGNKLYLFVKIPDRNVVQTVIIDRKNWPFK